MATSGTIGQTVIRVSDVIDAGMRRARIPAAAQTPETSEIGRRVIFTWLSALPNHGPLQWTVTNWILGTVPNRIRYDMPNGAVDVRNLLYRTMTRPSGSASSSAGGTASNAFDADVTTACTQTSADGNISLQYATTQAIATVGVMANGAHTWDLVYEVSSDGATWTEVFAPGAEDYPDKDWVYHDIETPEEALYFRVRETGGGTLDVRELYWGFAANEITIARLNQDDYTSQSNKTQTGSPITSFFVTRKASVVQVYAWPTANTWFQQISVWGWLYPQDPGALPNTIEIPQRWQKALIDETAFQLAIEVGAQVGLDGKWIDYLRQVAERSTAEAEIEERDDSPIFFGGGASAAYTA